jgi:hypothetical protein
MTTTKEQLQKDAQAADDLFWQHLERVYGDDADQARYYRSHRDRELINVKVARDFAVRKWEDAAFGRRLIVTKYI